MSEITPGMIMMRETANQRYRRLTSVVMLLVP
jgi:hypothetical protein